MRRLLLISLATIPLAGCQFFNREGTTVVDVIESVESGEALEAIPNKVENMAKGDAEEADKAFDEPTVKGEEKGVVTADLIKSTDPEARLKAIALSRPDPFATLVPPTTGPIVITPLPDPDSPPVRSANSGGSAAGNATVTNANNTNNAASRPEPPAPTPPPVRVQPPNEPLVVPSPIATLPTVPQPVIAPTVSVSGVIQLGNEPYAIVRSGSEPERYVRVGDRIAGGSVRVKRIETLAFEPRVILEENGIEVPRPVVSGDAATEEEAAAEPVAALPAVTVPSADIPMGTLPTAASFTRQSLPTPDGSLPSNSISGAGPASSSSVPAQSAQPAAGAVPDSLLLSPAEADLRAVIPGFQIAV